MKQFGIKTLLLGALLLVCLAVIPAWSQQKPVMGKYWVEFTDKDHTPYCTCRPWEFLSARALDRRARAGIAVVNNDLPVDPQYVQGLIQKGAVVYHTSRWMNAATVMGDTTLASALRKLPYVRKVTYIGRHIPAKNPPNRPAKKRTPLTKIPTIEGNENPMGYASLQNSLLNMPYLHWAGAKGDGIVVAVMDGGFTNVDTMPFFDSVALQGRLFPGWDFVERDNGIYEGAQHGTSVLSVMAANLPGYFVGVAPEATYFLLKTEDTGGEYPVEEANWIAGAEWADSIGADILNASLGYTVFNDTTLGHRRWELDGRTAIGSRGAAIAATKGMIIFNSAGNSGDEPWRYVGVPADAPGIIAVGAIDENYKHAAFSSQGPTADGRIKPELSAPGDGVVVAGNVGTQLGLSSGTSLASPMLAGSVAALWSAFPNRTAAEILEAVYANSSQNEAPDNLLGYGVPDITQAWLQLSGYVNRSVANDTHNYAFFTPAHDGFNFLFFKEQKQTPVAVEFRSIEGSNKTNASFTQNRYRIATLHAGGIDDLKPGAYEAVLIYEDHCERLLALKW